MKPKEVEPGGDNKQECGEALGVVKAVATEGVTVITAKQVPSAPDTRKRKTILTSQWPSGRAKVSLQGHIGHEAWSPRMGVELKQFTPKTRRKNRRLCWRWWIHTQEHLEEINLEKGGDEMQSVKEGDEHER